MQLKKVPRLKPLGRVFHRLCTLLSAECVNNNTGSLKTAQAVFRLPIWHDTGKTITSYTNSVTAIMRFYRPALESRTSRLPARFAILFAGNPNNAQLNQYAASRKSAAPNLVLNVNDALHFAINACVQYSKANNGSNSKEKG